MAVSQFYLSWRIKNLCLNNPDEQEKDMTIYKRKQEYERFKNAKVKTNLIYKDNMSGLEGTEENDLYRFRMFQTPIPGIICCTGIPGKLQMFNVRTRSIEQEIQLFEYNSSTLPRLN